LDNLMRLIHKEYIAKHELKKKGMGKEELSREEQRKIEN